MLARERWQQVSQAVAALPDRQRLVFTLSQVDEQTPAEIAVGDRDVRRHGSGPFVSGAAQTARYVWESTHDRTRGNGPDDWPPRSTPIVPPRTRSRRHFDERALEAQRQRILQRIEQAGQRARVLHFPTTTATARPSVAGVSRRWISAAAAAGLLDRPRRPDSCCT